jgi:hypothetical protein
VVGEVVGDVVGEVVGDVVGDAVVVVVPVGDGAGGPEALVIGVAARTGAQVAASFFAAAFIAATAFCSGAGSGIFTVPVPDPVREPPEDVDPVAVVDRVEPVPVLPPLAAADPEDDPDEDPEEEPVAEDGRAEEPDAPEPDELDDEVVVVDSSDVSCACDWSRAAWASVTAACSGVWSIVASCWPGLMVSPTLTDTPVTVPLTGKAAVTWDTRLTVPVSVSVCETEPLVAAARR